MASLIPSAGGTGTGSCTLQGPSTNSNQTITLPDATGTVALTNTQTMQLISKQTASSSATIDFTSISNSTYEYYKLIITNAIPSTTNVNLLLQVSVAGSFLTSGYLWQNWRWTTSGNGVVGQLSGSGIALDAAGADNMSNTVGGSWSVEIFNCANSGVKNVNYQGLYQGSALLGVTGNGQPPTGSSAVDGFRLKMDNGNIASGTFALYGIRNS